MTSCKLLVFVMAASSAAAVAQETPALEFPGAPRGKAAARLDDHRLVLENRLLRATWNLKAGQFELVEAGERERFGHDGRPMPTVRTGRADAFVVTLGDGESLRAAQFVPAGKPTLQRLDPEPDSRKPSHRFAGWRASVPLVSPDGRLRARWEATLRDEANYLRQALTLQPEADEVAVQEVTLWNVPVPNAKVAGVVDGSPVVAGPPGIPDWPALRVPEPGVVDGLPVVGGPLFFACEHPMAANRVEDGRVTCSQRCYAPLKPGRPWTASAVIGVAPPHQMRRAFLYYVERERARPYGLFLHYNSWWDIAWGDRLMNEKQCLDVIETFGHELVRKRGVKMQSFVFDDGWDDPKTLWGFHDGFPQGFTPLKEVAAKYDSAVGTWLSPWGGYGQRRAQRMEYGKSEGFETNARGFSLAGPKYYARFRGICAEMIKEYGTNYFKFDGIARGIGSEGAGDEFAPDVEGLLRLCTELRELRPDVYLSITTGTWPSPYWLWYGDSVWRNGHDWAAHGAGSVRQQWITYRDMTVYRMIVQRAPLYPINSLMTVTVCYGQLGTATRMSDDVDDLVDEIRMAFGSGTQLLELYVTPQMMKPEAWDALAECARWSRENADVLVDVHWVGGDPGEGQPYGYAAWSPRKGILVLRNPSEAPAELTLRLEGVLEVPIGAGGYFYSVASRWPTADRIPKRTVSSYGPCKFELAPFEVLILEALPAD